VRYSSINDVLLVLTTSDDDDDRKLHEIAQVACCGEGKQGKSCCQANLKAADDQ